MSITEKKNSKFYSYVIIARSIYNTWRIDNSITSFPREKTFMREIIIIYIETYNMSSKECWQHCLTALEKIIRATCKRLNKE